MALNTTTGSGTQSATGTPQSVGGPTTNAASAGSVQPGTATTLLNSSSGISLSGSKLTTVDMTATSATTQATTEPPAEPHHINTAALAICAVLAVIAVIVFVSMTRSAKNTTH